MSQSDNKKKKKKLFDRFKRKKHKTSKNSTNNNNNNIDLDAINNNDHTADQLNNDDIKTSKETDAKLTQSRRTKSGDSDATELQSCDGDIDGIEEAEAAEATEGDEIGDLVNRMTKILIKLKETCHTKNNTHHAMDLERFQKLIDWVDYNESHLKLLQKAWTDASFWPFLATEEATKRVKEEPELMLIRLSNTKPGAITVTRSAKDIVKHKRYFPSAEFGKLTLTGSWGDREVTWDGLLAHLKQKECCICLEELKDEEVLRLNCGHHFHRHCIERHVQHSKRMNNSEFATCPLCRSPIKNAQLIQEPTLAKYDKVPHSQMMQKKSKSFNVLQIDHFNGGIGDEPRTPSLRSKYNDGIKRAATENLTPTSPQHDDDNDNAKHMLELMGDFNNINNTHKQPPIANNEADHEITINDLDKMHLHNDVPENHPWHQHMFGNHLDVGSSFDDNYGDDEYSNAATAANIAKYRQQQQ